MKTTQEQKWLDALIIELRLRDVSGTGIGDVLATVKEFVADSGESPQEAFGSPAEYAASLDLSAATEPTSIKGTVIRSVIGLLAFLGFTLATTPWATGETLDLGVAQLAWLAVPLVLVLCLPLCLGLLLRRIWLFFLYLAVGSASGILAALNAPRDPGEVWISINPGIVLLATGAVMVAMAVASTVASTKLENDAIREPLEASATTRKNRIKAQLVGILGAWLFPIFAVVFLGVGFLFG